MTTLLDLSITCSDVYLYRTKRSDMNLSAFDFAIDIRKIKCTVKYYLNDSDEFDDDDFDYFDDFVFDMENKVTNARHNVVRKLEETKFKQNTTEYNNEYSYQLRKNIITEFNSILKHILRLDLPMGNYKFREIVQYLICIPMENDIYIPNADVCIHLMNDATRNDRDAIDIGYVTNGRDMQFSSNITIKYVYSKKYYVLQCSENAYSFNKIIKMKFGVQSQHLKLQVANGNISYEILIPSLYLVTGFVDMLHRIMEGYSPSRPVIEVPNLLEMDSPPAPLQTSALTQESSAFTTEVTTESTPDTTENTAANITTPEE